MTLPIRRGALAAALTAVLVLPAATSSAAVSPTAAPTTAVRLVPAALPEPPPEVAARVQLAELVIADPQPMTGYSRAKFPHWITVSGTCDTRETVLARDGQDVKQDDQCRAISGEWVSPYDDKAFTSAGQLDIDHVVPLANAWRSGADAWDTARRRAFANDLSDPQLVAVSAASNRSKGDQSPDQWAPPLRSYWCTYARAWTDIKYIYQLTVTPPRRTSSPRCSTPARTSDARPRAAGPPARPGAGRPGRRDDRRRRSHHRGSDHHHHRPR